MPLVHFCNWRGCQRIIPKDKRFCDEHQALHNQQWSPRYTKQSKRNADKIYNHFRRDQEANAFYHSKAWTETRDYVKQRDKMVSGLSHRMLNDHDYIVDHIVPRRLVDDPLDAHNLWLLSRREHNRKTKYEETLPDSVLKKLTADDWRHKLSINIK